MEFVEAALHEIDEELCDDEIEELCYVVRMSQKRIWRPASGTAAHLLRTLQNLRGYGKRSRHAGRVGGEVAKKVTGSQATPRGGFASWSRKRRPQGDASHLEGAGEPGT